MYGATRMWYENLINFDSMLSEPCDNGVFSGVIKQGLGSATMQVQGGFTGHDDLIYTIRIYSFTGGSQEIYTGGTGASYVWSDNAGNTGSSATSTSYTAVGAYGLEIKFTAGTGNDFELNDTFYVTGNATFSAKNLFDERRDTYLKKFLPSLPSTLYSWEFSAASVQAGDALVFSLHDYGIVGTLNTVIVPTTFQLRAGQDTFINEYTRTLTWNPGEPLVEYLTDLDPAKTYSYWALDVLHPGAYPLTAYLWIGQMFLGKYIEFPTAAMWNWGSQHDRQTSFVGNSQNVDVVRQISGQRRIITANWVNMKTTDFAILEALYDSILDRGDNIEHPVFFHEFSDVADSVYWMKAIDGSLNRTYSGFNRDDTTLKLMEVSPNYVL